MPGMNLKSGRRSGARRFPVPFELLSDASGIVIEREMAIFPRMKLDNVGADCRRCLDRFDIGLDEQRNPDTRILELRY